jgi:hypothetical protein
MRENPAGEVPFGTPGSRALGAIGSAVRRARETQGGEVRTEPGEAAVPNPTTERRAVPTRDERARSRLLGAIVTVSVFIAVGIALIFSLPSTRSPSSSPLTEPPRTPHHTQAPPTGTAGASPQGGTAATPTTSVPAPVVVPAGPPMITSIDPTSGPSGQGIEVKGANFLSSSGQIVAMFDGNVAPTNCPTQNVCNVTVPPASASTRARVTVTTSSGTSNTVIFTYSP